MTPGMSAMIDFMGSVMALPDPVVAKTTYDAAWAGNVGVPGSQLYDWFATNFEITFAEIELFPGVLVEAAIWTFGNYTSYNLFKGTEAWSCPSPCKYTSPPFNFP